MARDVARALAAVPHAEARAGVCIIDLRDGAIVFERSADTPLIPASAMKVLTMSAALVELGPEFHFETVLATDGENLVVIGDGDPAIGDDRLSRERGESNLAVFVQWATVLRGNGFFDIPGDLLFDDSVFDDERLHRTWEPGDLGKWYAAPVGGLNLNDNCLDITVHPGATSGAPVRVDVHPPNTLVQIVNRCKTGAGKPILHHPPGTMEYRISGRCGKTWPFGPVAFPDPGMLFADSLRTVLTGEGVVVRGSIRRVRVRDAHGAISGSWRILAVHRTAIGDVLRRAGKDSQNLFAECLFKRAGYERARLRGKSEVRGSFALGQEAVEGMCADAGLDRNGLHVADGSGLSRENRVTARLLTQLLSWAHRQRWGALLHDTLSVAGVDGSLRKRMKDMPGRVYAKTGTMRGVRTLAGYIDDDRGPRYAFAILFNGYPGSSRPYKDIQDRVCRILAGAKEASFSSP